MAGKTLFEGGASGVLFYDRRKILISPERTAELWSDLAPFTTFVMNLEVRQVDDALFKMFEHRSAFPKQRFTVSTATTIAAAGTESAAITVASMEGLNTTVNSSYRGLLCEVWDSTLTTKRGVCFISSINTEGAATVGKIKCKTAKASAITTVSGDYFAVIGSVRGESSVAPEAWADTVSTVWNSTHFFSTAVEVTGDLYKASLRGYSSELARLRDEKAKEFKMQKEHGLLKSVSTVGTNLDSASATNALTEANLRTISDSNSNSGSVRTTYGYISILEDYGVSTDGDEDQNVFSITESSYDYPDYVNDTEVIFDKTDDQRYSFSGRGAMSYWSKLGTSNSFSGKSGWTVELNDFKQNKLGFNVRTMETPHGLLYLVPTKALRHQYNNYMCIPDHEHMFLAQYEQDEFRNNIKTDDDYDGVKDVYRAKVGLGMDLIERHHMISIT